MSMEKELPKGWVNCTVGFVADLIRGVSYDKKDARNESSKGLLPILRANNINQTINYDELIYLPPKYIKEEQWLHMYDIVIAMSSGSKNLVGKAAQITDNCPKSFGAFCGVIRPSSMIEPKYLGYFFQSKSYRDYVSQLSKGVNINNLKREHITDIELLLAPLNEQKRIVSKIEELFSDLDEGEAALKKVQKLLARYRQAVLKAAVTGELTKDWREANKHRLESGEALLQRILQVRREQWQGKGKYQEPAAPGTSNLPELPEGWTLATIEQLASAVEYGTSAKCNQDVNGVAVLRMGNIFEGQLLLNDLKYLPVDHDEFPQLLLEPGDLLFNRTNSAELVGKTAVYHGKPDKCSFASYLIRVRFIETEPEFLSGFVNSVYGRDWIRGVVSQQVGQANVNGTKLKNLTIPLPPKEEQGEIVQKLGDIFSRIDTLKNWCQTGLARSSALRQSILKDAFSGKLVPQDPADEPAGELLKRIQAEREQQSAGKTQRSKRKEQPTLWESA